MLTRRLATKSVRDGLILGAAVGFGFSAFESAGYALMALFTQQGLSLDQLVTTEILRGVLAPLGHGLWTGILGGVLFWRSTRQHFLLTGRLMIAYLGVSLLHALWDSMPNISAMLPLLLLLTSQSWQYELLRYGWIPQPTSEQVQLYTVLDWVGLGLVSAVGLLWLGLLVRTSRLRTPKSPTLAARAAARHPAVPTVGPFDL